jgi:small-conductance mechanosensitive channel
MGYVWAAVEALPTILVAVAVLGVTWWLARMAPRVAGVLIDRLTEDKSLQRLGGITSRVLVWAVGTVIAATVVFPGLGVGDLVGVLGLTSVAIGFAFKDIFQNFLAGIIILAQRPFHIGDQIKVQDMEGTVRDIQIRFTAIETYDGERIILPNSDLYTNAVLVRTANATRRSRFHTGIAYDEDINKAREVILNALKDCDAVASEPAPRALVVGHGDNSINFEVLYWTRSHIGQVRSAGDQVGTRIKYALDEAGIEIPFPQRVLHMPALANLKPLNDGDEGQPEDSDEKPRPRLALYS